MAKINPKRLFRSKDDKTIAGVCSGIAEYLEIDPVIIRLLLVLLIFGYGAGILMYLLALLIIPLRK